VNEIRSWTRRDAAETYNVHAWGAGYFHVNEVGHIQVTPEGADGPAVDLHDLVLDLRARGIGLPILVRFSDILHSRVKTICSSFQAAIQEYGYKGSYKGVFPIKVNQQHHVVEELVRFSRPYNLGLEAGSKPELLVALALQDNPEALLILNGYKDVEYIETALLAQRLGRYSIIVIDRFRELELVIQAAERLGIRPHIGVRAKLSARGAGKWAESTGDRSKFGLTSTELLALCDRLRQADMLDCLELVHFHIGSQISAIHAIKESMKEAMRFYVELAAQGAGLKFIDVGGGLGVDYDGSQTNWSSSMNYSVQEYANDVVGAVLDACNERGLPHPDIVSESGRALVAHHSVLVFDILDVNEVRNGQPLPGPVGDDEHPVIKSLAETWRGVTRKNFQEAYHDALQLKDEATSLFNLGYFDLAQRARVEQLFWGCCEAILRIIKELEYVPDDLEALEKGMADTYFGNFSVFQSAPDHWAVKQVFPVVPLHRLLERPTRKGVFADLTCDSDGKMDRFIDLRDVKTSLELHPYNGESYYMGVFLVGAYQEILGDLHNLFGDTNAVHVRVTKDGYFIDHVVEGDSVSEVLGYVQYDRADLVRRVRRASEEALRSRSISFEESALLLRRFEEGLAGYTYLEESTEMLTPVKPATPAPATQG